jgi:catechol 2,3-dioxygenase
MKNGLPSGTRLGHVHLTVASMDLALHFYTQALGLEPLERDESSVRLGAPGEKTLVVITEAPEARPKPTRTTGLYHYALLLPNRKHLARFFLHIRELDYPLVGAADHLVSEAIYLQDPDGHGVEVYADRPRETWYKQDGGLRMATHALDTEALIAELDDGDREWQEMPSGTMLGHIHFQVADLEEAVEFYQQALGFDLNLAYGPRAAFLSVDGYHHHIGLNTWAGVGAPRPPDDAATLRYVSLVIPSASEVERIHSRLMESGFEPKERPEVLSVEDPSGNVIFIHSV